MRPGPRGAGALRPMGRGAGGHGGLSPGTGRAGFTSRPTRGPAVTKHRPRAGAAGDVPVSCLAPVVGGRGGPSPARGLPAVAITQRRGLGVVSGLSASVPGEGPPRVGRGRGGVQPPACTAPPASSASAPAGGQPGSQPRWARRGLPRSPPAWGVGAPLRPHSSPMGPATCSPAHAAQCWRGLWCPGAVSRQWDACAGAGSFLPAGAFAALTLPVALSLCPRGG